jgi:hypothetical protein
MQPFEALRLEDLRLSDRSMLNTVACSIPPGGA